MLKEGDDGLDLGAVGHLILDLLDDVEYTRLTVEEQTIGIGDVLLHLLVDARKLHHRGVRTTIGHRITTGDDKRGHVVREGTTCLNQRESTSTRIGILDGTGGEDDAIADLTVACNLGAIAKHAVVAHYSVVADMGTFEQEVIVTDDGTAIPVRATVDDHILTDHIIITDLRVGFGTTVVEVLRQGSDHRALVDLVVVADT